MPLARPPAAAKVSPRAASLPAGTRLWRVHESRRSAAEFKEVESDPHFGGNRFDSTPDDRFPYLYVAAEARTALLETLVRAIPFDDYRSITAVEPACDLTLISLLATEDLARACQDEWLTQAPPAEYPQTRRWAQWLRSRTPWAQGMIWPSARNLGCRSLVLWGDRIPAGVLTVAPGTTVDLAGAHGASWLNRQLEPYRVTVRPPAKAPTITPAYRLARLSLHTVTVASA
jgi:hypothetical protein